MKLFLQNAADQYDHDQRCRMHPTTTVQLLIPTRDQLFGCIQSKERDDP
jgi:hypothetical protein